MNVALVSRLLVCTMAFSLPAGLVCSVTVDFSPWPAAVMVRILMGEQRECCRSAASCARMPQVHCHKKMRLQNGSWAERYHHSFPTTLAVSAAKAADRCEEEYILLGTAIDKDDCAAAIQLGKEQQASLMCFLLLFVPETPPNAGDDWSWNWMVFCPHSEGRSFLLALSKQSGLNGLSNAQLQQLVNEVALAQSPSQSFAPTASAVTSTLSGLTSGLAEYFKEAFGDEKVKPDQGAGLRSRRASRGRKEAADELNNGLTWSKWFVVHRETAMPNQDHRPHHQHRPGLMVCVMLVSWSMSWSSLAMLADEYGLAQIGATICLPDHDAEGGRS